MTRRAALLIGMGIAITGLSGLTASPVIATPDAIAATPGGEHAPNRSGPEVAIAVPLVARYGALERFATAVSTLGSSRYGAYRPLSALERRFGASARTRLAVVRYLRAHGASQVRADSTGLFIDAQMPRADVERTFGSASAARNGRSRVPAGLRGLATGVVGLDTSKLRLTPSAAPPPSGYQPATGTPAGCSAAQARGGFTPRQFLQAYGYSTVQAHALRGSGESVALIEVDGFKQSDVNTFARCFGLPDPHVRAHPVRMRHALKPGAESTLDLEILTAAAPRLKRINVYETGPTAVSVLEALTAPLQRRALHPQVISVSLGLCEVELRQAVGLAGIRASNAALALAVASGISVVAATGDSGSSDCVDEMSGYPLPFLAVNYPASSPWVTAVGATNFQLDSANAIVGQSVWNDRALAPGDASGGGLSQIFKRPGYQLGTVAPNRRSIPDIAMLGDIAPGYDIYCSAASALCHRGWWPVGGTSAATPLVAGGLAMLDQRLRQLRKRPLGLVNSLLYAVGRRATSAASVFDDVTVGDNDVIPYVYAGGQPLSCCSATVGYDDASGWGSINLPALEAQANARQPKLPRR